MSTTLTHTVKPGRRDTPQRMKLTSFVALTAEAAACSKTKASAEISQMHQTMKPSGERP